MNCRSENRGQRTEDRGQIVENRYLSSVIRHPSSGFTLMEGMAAVTLLAFISVSVWVVMERCMMSAADSTQRMRAFEIAHENMEKLLGSTSVEEMTEYGVCEKFPDIRWQTTVETFDLPINTGMWVRAVCTAEYSDSTGENKTVELTHWLTGLTKDQVQELNRRAELKNQMLAEHIIETENLAAEYAGVSVETIRQWVQNGMPLTEGGEYLKPWLDLYLQTGGSPSEEEKQTVISEHPELPAVVPGQVPPNQQAEPTSEPPSGEEETLPEDINLENMEGI